MTAADFVISLVHLTPGWRYWARCRRNGFDVEFGLHEDGYATETEAKRAVSRAVARETRRQARTS